MDEWPQTRLLNTSMLVMGLPSIKFQAGHICWTSVFLIIICLFVCFLPSLEIIEILCGESAWKQSSRIPSIQMSHLSLLLLFNNTITDFPGLASRAWEAGWWCKGNTLWKQTQTFFFHLTSLAWGQAHPSCQQRPMHCWKGLLCLWFSGSPYRVLFSEYNVGIKCSAEKHPSKGKERSIGNN